MNRSCRRVNIVIAALVAAFFCACYPAFSQDAGTSEEVEQFDFANGLFSRGMFDMAIKGYRDFMNDYPGSQYYKQANFRIAESFFMGEKYDEALDRFNGFLKKYPTEKLSRNASLRIGQIYYFQGDYDRAESVFTGPFIINADIDVTAPAKYYTACSYYKRGDLETAKNLFEKLIAEEGGSEYKPFVYMNLGDIYVELKDHARAAEAYSKAGLLASPGSGVASAAPFRAADSYYLAGEYSPALAYYKKIASGAGGEVFDRAAAGMISSMYRSGDHNRVINEAEALIERIGSGEARSKGMFILGSSYFNEDRFSEAENIFALTAKDYPGTEYGIKAKLNRGWMLYETGKFDDCIIEVDSYMEMTEDLRDEAMFVKAKAMAGAGKAEEALDIYNKITEGFKGSNFSKDAFYEIGWLYNEMDQPEKAIDHFEMFADEYPDDPRSPAVLLKAGQEHFRIGNYEEAVKDHSKFLSLYGDNKLKENVLFQLGRAYIRQNDHDRAIEVFDKFVKEFPSSEVKRAAVFWTAKSYQNKNELDRAIEVYSELIEDESGELYGRALESMAYSYFLKGDYRGASDKYYKVISGGTDIKLSDSVYRWLAGYYLGQNKINLSLSVLRALSDEYPEMSESAEVSYLMGENNRRSGKWSDAADYFNKALDSGADAACAERSRLGLGRAYAAGGKNDEALAAFSKALEDHKDNETGIIARFETGNINLSMKNYDEAAKQFLMVAILYEDTEYCPKALFRAGLSFEKAGSPDKSIDAFRELIKRYPDDPLAEKAAIKIKQLQK